MPEEIAQTRKFVLPPARALKTPFNMVAGSILLIGLIITVVRFTAGLGAAAEPLRGIASFVRISVVGPDGTLASETFDVDEEQGRLVGVPTD